jgi:hypothetical protein
MVHIRTEGVKHWQIQHPLQEPAKNLPQVLALPKPTPPKGCERAAFCLVESFYYLLVFEGESKKLSGSLFLYEPLFWSTKVL